MTRTPIIAAILTALAAGGVAAVAMDDPSPSMSLITAGQEVGEPAGDDDEEPEPSTTSTTATLGPLETTTTSTAPPTTTTSLVPTTTTAPPTTSTTAAPAARPLALRCAPHGGDGKTGDDHHRAGITCVVDGVHERAAKLTLSRDGVKIARTDDLSVTTYTDKDVRPGITYSYQAHAYAHDGTLLQASDAIRATAPADAGGGDRYDGPMVMRCAGTAPKTDRPGIGCEWKGVPDGTTTLALSRDGVVIVRKDDPTKTGYWDGDVEPGRTYTYVLQAHAADGTVLAATEPVAATAGEGA